jgi:mRNA interferase MazF
MSRTPRPRRGDVWFVDLNPIRGHEQSGHRPAMVISADLFNRGPAGLVVVLPLTSSHRDIPMHIPLDPPDGGVRQRSYIMCDQIRTISLERLLNRWGKVSYSVMADVEDRIATLLDLP